jgi:ABC-type multidrug transport system fused ATPase/permease subunit
MDVNDITFLIIFLIIFLLFLLSISIGFFVFFKKKKKLLGIFFIALGLSLNPLSLIGPGIPLPYIYSISRGECFKPSPIPFVEIPMTPILWIDRYITKKYMKEEGSIFPFHWISCPSLPVLNIPFLLINIIFWYSIVFFVLKLNINKIYKILLLVLIILFVIIICNAFYIYIYYHPLSFEKILFILLGK